MPFYDVKCENGHEYEIKKSIKDDLPECKECGGKLEIIIRSTGFTLKNGKSGWANNGYSSIKSNADNG